MMGDDSMLDMPLKKSVADFLPLGAIIHSFRVDGINIVQHFNKAEHYRDYNVPYFGETIGRVANRIKNATIENLNGRAYQLAANNGPNCLHGGLSGWGKKLWKLHDVTERSIDCDLKVQWKFGYQSKDGEEGFPGTVESTVTYTEGVESGPSGEEISVLEIEYEAELLSGADETVLAMTNHRLVVHIDLSCLFLQDA
jgi:aldose 1-epimerase